VPDKENTKYFTGTKKCGVEKIPQRAQPDWDFSEPKMPDLGHFAVTVCYMPFAFF
jgi:hypothetical protein